MAVDDIQYGADFTDLLEIVWGKGLLSPGGTASIDLMVQGIPLAGKHVLDVGCGIGGPAVYLAKQYGCSVCGVDVEPQLIETARARAAGTHAQVDFQLIKRDGHLPLADSSVDVIFGKESWLHIQDKPTFLQEAYRVLRPGGWLVNLDWLHRSSEYSDAMKSFVEVDGLTMYLGSADDYCHWLQQAGFSDINVKDTSQMTLAETQEDIQKLQSTCKDAVIARLGEAEYQASFESWQLQANVFESGELQTALFTARK